jgi:4-carboxymuconolactone decarboxylase
MLDTATGMPADIDTTTLSRLPEITRSDLDEDGQRIYDLVIGPDRTTPVIGPAAISFHSPRVAEAMHLLNQYLRYESVLGRRFTEVAILVAARELDQQFEWTRHEAAAREEGVSQAVIDTIKFDRPVRNLSREETLIINYGRQIFRQHRLSSGLFAEAVALFGTQGAFELAAIMGDYAMAGIMLHAVDQQLPVDEAPLLPVVE